MILQEICDSYFRETRPPKNQALYEVTLYFTLKTLKEPTNHTQVALTGSNYSLKKLLH